MSLRILLIALLVFALGLSLGFIFLSGIYLEQHILLLLPTTLAADIFEPLHRLFQMQLLAMLVFMALLATLFFWLASQFIARPLHLLLGAMQAFAERGERTELSVPAVPKEIHALAGVFTEFANRVEASHKRDVEISRVKSDFISTAAHQFRTPLTGIRWALEALERENLSDSQKALVKSAVDKSHDLVSIVSTLLDISSIESGKYKYAMKPVDLQKLVEDIARDFSPLATQNKVSLLYAEGEGGLPRVTADRERIKWILNNLVENAIQYTPAGGTVRIMTETGPERVYVRVRDTGIGIAASDRGNIFERFYRAPNAVSKQNKGNGLGLYIARTIATDHGGDLNFSPNEEGPGTTFTLSLPLSLPPRKA